MKTREFLLKSLKKALKTSLEHGKTAHSLAISREIERLDSIPEAKAVSAMEASLKRLQEEVDALKPMANWARVNGGQREQQLGLR